MSVKVEHPMKLCSDQERTVAREGAAKAPLLTVMVPVYNEADTVTQLLDLVLAEKTSKEIIIVDDGSGDGSIDRIKSWLKGLNESAKSVRENDSWKSATDCCFVTEISRDDRSDAACFLPEHMHRVVVLKHHGNRGKGSAIRTALSEAKGNFTIVQDADLEVSPEAYPSLLEPLIKGDADFVIGWRSDMHGGRLMHRAGVGLLNLAVRVLYRVRLTDEACCFKMLRTSDFLRMDLACRGFEFCPEVVAKAIRLGLRIHEVPVNYNPRTLAEGKKLRLRDGLQALATLFKYRFWKAAPPTAVATEVSESIGASPADSVQKR